MHQTCKKMKKSYNTLKSLMLAATFVMSCGFFTQCSNAQTSENDLPIETLTELKTAFPKAACVELLEPSCYAVKNAKGKVIGSVLLSSPYSDDIKGFNGPTPLQIALDKKGRILEVRVLDNEETPRFLNHVIEAGFLDSWKGKTVLEALDMEVDAVSGATFSSKAIQNSLKARLNALAK